MILRVLDIRSNTATSMVRPANRRTLPTMTRNLPALAVATCLSVLTACSATQTPTHPGAAAAGGGPTQEGPAYFTQATSTGARYAHNWVRRPCFTLEVPGGGWILETATADYVQWRRGGEVLKVYLADNRDAAFAVSGMNPEGVLRGFIGYELDYVRPKFEISRAVPPQIDLNAQGVWAHWGWEGRSGKRAGVGRGKPAD